eukprot:CAMPEP_0182527600 /NCGR_PEP_ID=MMETSP1323-20130603/3956_1 /TAXON_ID=236787 /ORGANISM="Florenciella parvula, Strain RCC1693" /LENGTH=107 /DNA_ID=CAMNT_0024736605 /DNA_START=258 /DNA_END=581 /DNA_ORIENTATION=+
MAHGSSFCPLSHAMGGGVPLSLSSSSRSVSSIVSVIMAPSSKGSVRPSPGKPISVEAEEEEEEEGGCMAPHPRRRAMRANSASACSEAWSEASKNPMNSTPFFEPSE